VDAPLPTTRFNVTDFVVGCLKVTASLAPTLKPCQLIIALWLPWLMETMPWLVAMLAEPAVTLPPVGRA
jgi:hypothetical protein